MERGEDRARLGEAGLSIWPVRERRSAPGRQSAAVILTRAPETKADPPAGRAPHECPKPGCSQSSIGLTRSAQ